MQKRSHSSRCSMPENSKAPVCKILQSIMYQKGYTQQSQRILLEGIKGSKRVEGF